MEKKEFKFEEIESNKFDELEDAFAPVFGFVCGCGPDRFGFWCG